jgi:hypothetical protein
VSGVTDSIAIAPNAGNSCVRTIDASPPTVDGLRCRSILLDVAQPLGRGVGERRPRSLGQLERATAWVLQRGPQPSLGQPLREVAGGAPRPLMTLVMSRASPPQSIVRVISATALTSPEGADVH